MSLEIRLLSYKGNGTQGERIVRTTFRGRNSKFGFKNTNFSFSRILDDQIFFCQKTRRNNFSDFFQQFRTSIFFPSKQLES